MRTIVEIAREISRKWESPYFAAKPYLEILRSGYHLFPGGEKSAALGFLANCATWRGDDARRLKAELREVLKNK